MLIQPGEYLSILEPIFLRPTSRMDQSERIRHLEEQAKRIVSRNKCMDSYARTMLVVQPKASGLATPISVAVGRVPAASYTDTPLTTPSNCNGVARGKGTNGEFIGILQARQSCAVEPDVQGTVILDVPCINTNAPPFTQSDMTRPDTWAKVPCRNDHNYFPTGELCDYARITTPS